MKTEKMSFDTTEPLKIYEQYSYGLNVDFDGTVKYTIKTGIEKKGYDTYLAKVFANLGDYHPHDMLMAGRINMHQLHKETPSTFIDCIGILWDNVAPNGKMKPLISKDIYPIIKKNHEKIQCEIDYTRDFQYNYISYSTLYKSYLMRRDDKVIERPQHMFMRVSLGIHLDDFKSAFETYHAMSQGYFIHATPTLFNAGTNSGQFASCFLVDMIADSIDGIYDTLKICARISKESGGIGFTSYKIRAKKSYISGTNGFSNGVVPMLKVFNESAKYVDQGGGKRKGAWADYMTPWHADYLDWLELKKNTGKNDLRARELFYASWISDTFMDRVHENGAWSMFCPTVAPRLLDTFGDEFKKWYEYYEEKKLYTIQMSARKLFNIICGALIEYSGCYILWKDAINRRNGQMNAGIIKSSNLCCEIVEFTAPDEVAVCNLASICLPKYVEQDKKTKKWSFNFKLFQHYLRIIVRNLDLIIDRTTYPVPEAKKSNLKHRPMGIGIQGLADVFFILGYVFGDKESSELNREIFECMYWTALDESANIAVKKGTYPSFKGSPASKGIFQFDMCTKTKPIFSGKWDWIGLRAKVKKNGLRNSLFIAPMPTASTSNIQGNTPSFEPPHGNIYMKSTLSGTFNWVNKYMVADFEKLGIMSKKLMAKIASNGGSVQGIKEIPIRYQQIYRTAFEIPSKTIIRMAVERNPFVDQSQSVSFFKEECKKKKLRSMLVHTWKAGLKNGVYYFRSKPAIKQIGFSNTELGSETLETRSNTNSPITTKDMTTFENLIVVKDRSIKIDPLSTNMKIKLQKKRIREKKKKKWNCNDDEGCTMCGS